MQKVFHIFPTNAKSVSIFLTIFEKCFTFFDKMRKVFEFFFVKPQKLSDIFHLCTILLVFFYNMCAKLIKFLYMCANLEH